MTLSYLDFITTLGLSSQQGARELLQMAMLADRERLVLRRRVTAKYLSRLLKQSVPTTSRHIKALVDRGVIHIEKHNRRSCYRLPEPKSA